MKHENLKATSIGKLINGQQFIQCKKSIATFKKGKSYIFAGMYGDPQGAHEDGYEYMVMKFVNAIIVKDQYNTLEETFEWKGRDTHMTKYKNIGFFQDYFVVDLAEERNKKLKKIEKCLRKKEAQ